MSLEYIRNYYKVPAKRGAKIKFKGKVYRILSAQGHYLNVTPCNAEDDSTLKYLIHPAWKVEYLTEASNAK